MTDIVHKILKTVKLKIMGQKTSYNVQNEVTGEFILNEAGVKVEYDTENEAMVSATYYTTTTGETHVVVGPHPRPHA